jgi:fucose 4-O-acetylase-like acetyltransferase
MRAFSEKDKTYKTVNTNTSISISPSVISLGTAATLSCRLAGRQCYKLNQFIGTSSLWQFIKHANNLLLQKGLYINLQSPLTNVSFYFSLKLKYLIQAVILLNSYTVSQPRREAVA